MMQETIVTTNRVTFSVEKGFCIVLCRLAYPQRLGKPMDTINLIPQLTWSASSV
jgi:hypothetical protein